MDLKTRAREEIVANKGSLLDLSHRIHAHPEVAFHESNAAEWVSAALNQAGFEVHPGAGELPTAFVARSGTGSLHIGICAEYDALPGLGHACGHNIIAAAAVGAARALATLADDLDLTVSVFGTPAEEFGGGKVLMLQRGVFDGVHAALMVHPHAIERDGMASLAVSQVEVAYTGRAAHAAARPEQGINAAAAMALAQMGIGMLREHMLPTDRVHGIVLHGGDAPNIVPERTTGRWYIRSREVSGLTALYERVLDVFRGAALMTGCSVEIRRTGPDYSEIISDEEMAALWRNNATTLGRTCLPISASDAFASTDMGNVSYAVPTIHPLVAIDAGGAGIHEARFAASTAGDSADKAILDGACMLAWTVIDAASDPQLRSRLLQKAYFVNEVAPESAAYLARDYEDVIRFDPAT